MGRKRKSDVISKDDDIDVVDLTEACEIEDDALSMPTAGILPVFDRSMPVADTELIYYGRKSLQQTSAGSAGTASRAAKTLKKSVKQSESGSQRTIKYSKNNRTSCESCRIKHIRCDLQRPICGDCQRRSTRHHLHTCAYSDDHTVLGNEAHNKAVTLTEQPAVEEVEVIDLDSDDDGEIKARNVKKPYEVESILGRRQFRPGGIQYLVKWKGCSDEESTWESVKNLKSAKALIGKFNATAQGETWPNPRKDFAPRQFHMSSQSSTNVHCSPNQRLKRIPEDVNRILACHDVPSTQEYQYLVEWKGLPPMERSWETESRFFDHKRIIQYYHIGYPYATNPPENSQVSVQSSTQSKPVWFSEDVHRIHLSRRTGLDEDPEYLVTNDSAQASWHTSEELSSTEALAAIWRFIGESKLWPMSSLRNLSVRQIHAWIHPRNGTPCIECSESRLMCDGHLPCSRCRILNRYDECAYKPPPYDEPAWPRPPPKLTTFQDELVNTQIASSTHRIECAIAWAAYKPIPFRSHFSATGQIKDRRKLAQGPLELVKQLKKEGEFWINSQVQRRMAAMSDEEKTRIKEHMAKDKRILPLLAKGYTDPISFYVRYEAKREWQAREARKELARNDPDRPIRRKRRKRKGW